MKIWLRAYILVFCNMQKTDFQLQKYQSTMWENHSTAKKDNREKMAIYSILKIIMASSKRQAL